MTSAATVPPHPGGGPRTGTAPRYAGAVVWLGAALLSYRFYWVVTRYAVNLFFFDEWDIYQGLFHDWPWWRFFLQEHGPHRQGVGVPIVVYLLRATHWDSRMQAYAIAAAIVMAMVLAIRLKTSAFGPLRVSDLVIPVLFLGLGQWEVLLSAPGPSAQAFPLLLLIVYCLAWIQKKAWLRYAGIAVLNFLLIYTGYGIFIVVLTLALLAIDAGHRWKTGATIAGPLLAWIASAASLASFFYGYIFSPAADCYQFPYRNPAAYPWFMGLMFAKFLGMKRAAAFPALVGIVVLVLLGIVLWRSTLLALRVREPGRFVVVILAGYSVIYAAAAAIGRICLGMSAAMSSRNVTLLIPGFLGLYFCLLISGSKRRNILITALLVAVLPSCIQRYRKEIEGFSAMKHAWKSCYRATENIPYCDASGGLQLYPRPEAIHLRDKLNFLKQNHLNLYANTGARVEHIQ